LVLLKIIKHCQENVPKIVTGSLLGLDLDEKLEVTNCFPFPSEDNAENDAYQIEMMKSLRAVNVDNNIVGWYQSALLGSYLSQSVIDIQYEFQKDIPKSVVVVYDSYRTISLCRLSLKAYRLTPQFMATYSKSLTQQPQKNVNDIFTELTIKVHNSHLVQAFLYELREHKSMRCDFDRLSLSSTPFVEKNLDLLSSTIDEYSSEQNKFQYYQRQVAKQKLQQQQHLTKTREENESRIARGEQPNRDEDLSKNSLWKPIPKPSRLESNLLGERIQLYTQQIMSTANYSFNQMYLIESLHKQT